MVWQMVNKNQLSNVADLDTGRTGLVNKFIEATGTSYPTWRSYHIFIEIPEIGDKIEIIYEGCQMPNENMGDDIHR
jgi:hypothetical protein